MEQEINAAFMGEWQINDAYVSCVWYRYRDPSGPCTAVSSVMCVPFQFCTEIFFYYVTLPLSISFIYNFSNTYLKIYLNHNLCFKIYTFNKTIFLENIIIHIECSITDAKELKRDRKIIYLYVLFIIVDIS